MAGETPFQTVGPYLHIGLRAGLSAMTRRDGGGTPMTVVGRLIDGAGAGISDGVLEFWAPGFTSVGRAFTGADGVYAIETRLPGDESADPGGAPHFAVRVLARGILTQYMTRMYVDGHPANADDAVLGAIAPDRRATLLARRRDDGQWSFDVVVQGPGETVFFDL